MRSKTTKYRTLSILFIILLLFSSCGTGQPAENMRQSSENAEAVEESSSENRLSASFKDSSRETGGANITQLMGARLYTASWQFDMEHMRQVDTKVYCEDSGAQAELIADFAEEELRYFVVDEEGSVYYLYGQGGQDEEYTYFLRKDTSQGTTEYCGEIQNPEENIVLEQQSFDGIYDGEADSEGRLCFVNREGEALFFGANGQLTSCVQTDWALQPGASQGVVNSQGSLFVYRIDGETVELRKVDMDAGKLDKEIKIPVKLQGNSKMAVYSGYEKGLLVSDGASLWCFVPGSVQGLDKLLDWGAEGIDLQPDYVEQIGIAGDGRYSVLYLDPYKNETVQVSIEEKTQPQADDGHTVILGCMDFGNTEGIERAVKEFNKRSEEYQVEMQVYDRGDYSRYYGDLLQGKGPDLFELSDMPQEMLADKGILEDLSPYFEQSAVISTEQLLPCVREAGMWEGKIVCVFPEFYMAGKIVEQGYTQDGGWTAEDFFALGEQYPQSRLTEMDAQPFNVMLNYLPVAIGSYVDWEKQECSFGSAEFQQMLEQLKANSRKEYSGEEYSTSAEKLFYKEILTLNATIAGIEGYLEIKDAFAGTAEFAGYPNQEGKPWYRLLTNEKYGMNSASDCKAGAWAFLEFLFSEEYQSECTTLFPSVKSSFEEYLAEGRGIFDSSDGKFVYYKNRFTDERKEGYPEFDDEDRKQLRYYAENAYMQESFSIRQIQGTVQEEVEAFFQGDKSAENVAKIIQNRISLYLQE